MQAAVVTRYGPPEVFELRDVPAPEPGDEVFGSRGEKFGGVSRCIDDVICDVLGKAGFPRSLRAIVAALLRGRSRTCGLHDIVEAHRHADTDHKVGNIVVLMPARD